MSPLDDELRRAMSSRTALVAPPPDLVATVERRAARMRRHRVTAAVAGSALAVAALGIAGPMLASSLPTSTSSPLDRATQAPEPRPDPTDRFALDPADPWPYRGEESVRARGHLDAYAAQWAAQHRLDVDDVDLTPLFGQVHEPSATAELVYLVRLQSTGESWWGVARAREPGPELTLDQPLLPGTTALLAVLPGDEVSRLLVVTSPEAAAVQYRRDAGSDWAPAAVLAPGVGAVALDGDPSADRVRVLAPGGATAFDGPAPDGELPGSEPSTDTGIAVDPAPYGLDLGDPWPYPGPSQPSLHPGLGAEAIRLFRQGGTGRGDGSWTERPLVAVDDEASGLSVVMVLHRNGAEAYVTTTWQTRDAAARQSEQQVRDGQLLVQTVLPDAGPAGWLVVLASPEATAVETDLVEDQPAGVITGVRIFELPPDPPAGSVFLYGEAGMLYHSEPARRS